MSNRMLAMALAVLALSVAALGWVIVPAAVGDDAPAAEPDNRPAVAPTTQPDSEAQAQRLLAMRERQQGPLHPGKDPAFLVMPRQGDRSDLPAQLLNLQVPDLNAPEGSTRTTSPREMADKALAYLARTQDPDGGWSDPEYPGNTGVTALACLAFMADGSRPRIGPYGRQIDRGMEFILKNVQTNGVISGKGANKLGPAYEHAYSTLALLFAYGDMPWRPQTRDVIAKSVQAIARSQKLDGGWRYQFSREGFSDMSVTANMLWVLRTAKKCGFTVNAESIKKGVDFVVSCAMPDGKHFRYRYHGIMAASEGLTGTGIIALVNQGRIDHPMIPKTRDQIRYEYTRYTIDDLKERRYYVYGCFYAALAMYMCGDEYWQPWYHKAANVLAHIQRKDGEFADQSDNTAYATAMAAMVLLAPRGYLPIFER
ncbi:MAG: hypothetical protein BIFFINMI_03911 [Phycisphaerae bacterium]|nr:hypothetical protein [Phycisphaerae bacterium]